MILLKMENVQAEFQDYSLEGFKPVLTADGSYSLQQKELSEEMHSRGGAFSESIYIYYKALESFFGNGKPEEKIDIQSIGLGLGYNEVLSALAIYNSKFKGECQIFSYEKEMVLKDLFQKRLDSPKNFPVYWKEFKKRFVFEEEALSKDLLEKFNFAGSFDKSSIDNMDFKQRVILFDAYSSKTSAELWEQKFIESLLSKCKLGSVLTTYAATGNLNRALKNQGFKNLGKDGFLHKRQSTFAVKV